MRTRSPSSAPPVNGDVGSTASTPTRRSSARYARTSALVTVDLPTPGEPVSPTTRAWPTCGATARITGLSSAEPFSTCETSRARDRASPSRAAATSASARESSGTRSVAARPRHPQQQRVTLAAAAAQRRRAEAAAAPLQLIGQVQREPGAAHPDRMAERDRAAIDVDDVLADLQIAHRLDRDRRERLVDFDQIQVRDRQPGFAERVLDGARRLRLQ